MRRNLWNLSLVLSPLGSRLLLPTPNSQRTRATRDNDTCWGLVTRHRHARGVCLVVLYRCEPALAHIAPLRDEVDIRLSCEAAPMQAATCAHL